MSHAPKNAHPAVARSLDLWHRMLAGNDLGKLHTIVHPDAVFRSPMANSPYGPAPALILVLSTVIQVFENFAYHRQLVSDDEQGRIVEFEVMVRPMSGLQALGAEMGRRLADKLPAFKVKT